MFYNRKRQVDIEKQIKTREIVVLTGMRRVGKTSLYRAIFDAIPSKNKVFLDIENPLDQKIFEETDYNNVWANLRPFGILPDKKAYVFLDEVQAFPNIIKAIKYLHDHYANVKFFLTGSSSFYLKNLFSESLAGRKVIIELFPLDFEEFLIFKGLPKEFYAGFHAKNTHKNAVFFEKTKKVYEEYLRYGGFPQVVLAKTNILKKQNLKDIFKSYFEKDVQSLADFKDIHHFRDLLLLLLQRIGSKLDVSKLASEVGVSRDTVYSYLSFLQETYFINLLSPFTKNVDQEVSGAKKIYVCDNGIAAQFTRIGDGALLENAVFNNLKKYGELRYYQRRSGAEIDFVLPEQKIALEVKQTGTEGDYKKLKGLAKFLGLKDAYVVAKNFNPAPGFIPASDI